MCCYHNAMEAYWCHAVQKSAQTNSSGRLITATEALLAAPKHLLTAPEHLPTAPEHFHNCSGTLS